MIEIKKKYPLEELAHLGCECRREMHPDILIGKRYANQLLFDEGDILDANATLDLIKDNYRDVEYEDALLAVADRVNAAETAISQNNTDIQELNTNINNTISLLRMSYDTDIANLNNAITNVSAEKGDKGERGDKGDTGEKGEKGDRGLGIKSIEQTTSSDENSGDNVISITLDDNTVSQIVIKNGDAAEVDAYTKAESDENMDQLEDRVTFKRQFLSNSEYLEIASPDADTVYFIYEDAEWGFGDNFPITLS